mmetsp:Transcript_72037/g.114208  ORF Transcript_72037/g.114208 Transcript_72037/m.114208 type:complete len:700 (-) Transcript_72037:38-2137(-)|eukprot:CAMPEP_0169099046 /NCGR_PEP_ID=MMETSP1015-20121227/20358_1 /TAXON_ID=342587 /ORGANISM="Karlodinium micrum, Strain CCMP2283" /LENGTH=699 /DNA_ID=CAMNT_0009159921 /DNA_START=91 /DNA_END=2190 /DNA_ORIENTATION=-
MAKREFAVKVSGIGRGVKDSDIRRFFDDAGYRDIFDVYVPPGMGFGFVKFSDEDEATRAVAQQTITVRGSELALEEHGKWERMSEEERKRKEEEAEAERKRREREEALEKVRAEEARKQEEIERKRREEEEAFERKKAELEETVEKKRAEEAKKQEEMEKALEEKLAAKRAEAALRPVKEVPQPKKKEKPSVATVDLKHMFHVEPDYEVVDAAQIQADLEADKQRRELLEAYAELAKAQEEKRIADAEMRKKRAEQKAALEEAQKNARAAAEKANAATKKVVARSKEEEKQAFLASEKERAIKAAPKKKNSIDIADMDDETFERQLREEEEKLEKKRMELQRRREEEERALEEKLAARRAEALTKPVKEVPQPKKKDKPSVARVDLQHMFQDREPEYEIVDTAEIQADLEADRQKRELAKAYAELAKANAELKQVVKEKPPAASTKATAKPTAKAAVKEKPPERESQWGEVAPKPQASLTAAMTEEKHKAIEEKLAAKRAEEQSKPQKEKEAPQPKKKDKKGAKMSLLDFYDANIVAEKEAVLEAEREKEAAEKEAAREAEEAAEWAAWEAAEAKRVREEAERKQMLGIDTNGSSKECEEEGESKQAPKIVATKAAPKPARRPPVELESKWGAPVAVSNISNGDEEDTEDPVGPSLAEALAVAPVKKTAPPQPKKKEKKKWAKIDATAIGFDADDPNHA